MNKVNEVNKKIKKSKSPKRMGKKQRNLILMIGCVVLLILIVIALKLGNKNDTSIAEKVVGSEDNAIKAGAMMEIDTPYGYLKYPQKFEKWIDIADTSDADELAITFYTSVTGDEVKMFTVCFGDEDKGEFIGYVTENDTKIPVTIEVFQEEIDDNISEDKMETYYDMVDGVNEILKSIMNFETYTEE